jgi:hypothetical protein
MDGQDLHLVVTGPSARDGTMTINIIRSFPVSANLHSRPM